jgi:4-hydroxyacetophenone monooxygenase
MQSQEPPRDAATGEVASETERDGAPNPAADRDTLVSAIELANIPTLLMILVQMTGALRWLEEPYRPTRTRGLSDNDDGGLDEAVQSTIRTAALHAIIEWQAGRPLAIPAPSPQLLTDMLSVAMGEPVPLDYADMLMHELGLDVNPRGASHVAPTHEFDVLIVGAGASGLCAAIKLQEAGIPYTIVERNDAIGGTWLDNRYPGCGVDTPSHLYSYSFARSDWSRYFASRDELHAYFERVANDFGVRDRIHFGTEVISAVYERDAQRWSIRTRTADGGEQTRSAAVVISAVGAFNKPKTPKIPGLETFAGPVAHTARWPQGIDLAGKRVAVIGNGASAMQLVPAIAETVQSLVLFQRSPQWAAPFEKFKVPVPEALRFLFREVPLYESWYRLRLAWTFNDKIHSALQKDPAWEFPERSLNAINDGYRRFFERYIVSELGDRQDLLDAVLPSYPPFGKRMLLDNGWFRTLTRDNVTLVTESVTAIDGSSVVAADGTAYEVDLLILATGFDVVQFLAPMEVVGRSGRTLYDTWGGDDARAYLGMTMPDFPNFFCLYGPNTQFGHGGSLIFMMELQMHYLMDLFQQMFAQGIRVVECRKDVHDRYNEEVDAAHEAMVWTHPGMDTYYRNSRGRVVVNNPFRVVDFWHRLRSADLSDYIAEPALAAAEPATSAQR